MTAHRRVIVDAELGELRRRGRFGGGAWHGSIELRGGLTVPLVLPGRRGAPHAIALDLARQAAEMYERAAADIAAALTEHAEPYGGLGVAGVTPSPAFVRVCTLAGREVLEFGYRVAWDDDHVLGARVHDGRLVELCGSVVEP